MPYRCISGQKGCTILLFWDLFSSPALAAHLRGHTPPESASRHGRAGARPLRKSGEGKMFPSHTDSFAESDRRQSGTGLRRPGSGRPTAGRCRGRGASGTSYRAGASVACTMSGRHLIRPFGPPSTHEGHNALKGKALRGARCGRGGPGCGGTAALDLPISAGKKGLRIPSGC